MRRLADSLFACMLSVQACMHIETCGGTNLPTETKTTKILVIFLLGLGFQYRKPKMLLIFSATRHLLFLICDHCGELA